MGNLDKVRFGSQPWYRKVGIVVLYPFLLLTIPFTLLGFAYLGLLAVSANYLRELRIRSRMRRHGRYLRLSEIRSRIGQNGGTLIIEKPSLGWNFSHAWWTPDDLLSTSPFPVPTDEDYRKAAHSMRCPDWDKWCWNNYTCLDTGRAYLLRVWNGASIQHELTDWFPDLKVVHTWTGLIHIPSPPEAPATNAA
jgi:hypothetical protein